MKTLYIHIGSPKTATTTLQATFKKNRQFLEDKGIYYFKDDAFMAHHRLTWALREKFNLPNHGVRKKIESLDIVVGKYLDEINHTDAEKIILSSEGFFSLGREAPAAIHLLKETFKEFNVKVIVYLRRQDKFLESNYAQSVKAAPFDRRTVSDLLFEVTTRDLYDYYDHIQPWATLFGKENIIVREFEKNQLINGNIIEDFLSVIESSSVSYKDLHVVKDKNLTPPSEAILLFNILNEFSINGRDRFDLYQEISLFCDSEKSNKNKNLLSSVQRRALYNSVYESNRKIADEYMQERKSFLYFDENEFTSTDSDINVEELLSKLPSCVLVKIVKNVIFEKKKDYSILSEAQNSNSDNQFFHDRIYDLSNQMKVLLDSKKDPDNKDFNDRIDDLSNQLGTLLDSRKVSEKSFKNRIRKFIRRVFIG